MIHPLPDDDTPNISSEFELYDTEPVLYPIYSTADSVKKRNEFVYQFADHQLKLIVGPVKQDHGWMWRVEPHPAPRDDEDYPKLYPTFQKAFEFAEDLATRQLVDTEDGKSLD